MGVKVDSYRDPMSLNTMDDGVPLWRVPKFWSTMDVNCGYEEDEDAGTENDAGIGVSLLRGPEVWPQVNE